MSGSRYKEHGLKQTHEVVMSALGHILDLYEQYRITLKKSCIEARTKTLIAYDDFYEWLEGKI